MDITEIEGKVLFMEDLSEISGAGAADKATRVELYTEDQIDGQVIKTKILDDSYYTDFDGMIRLDYKNIASRLTYPVIASGTTPFLSPSESDGYRSMLLRFKEQEYRFTANIFSADAKKMISDIDYMAIPENYIAIINVYAWWAVHEIGIESRGIYRKLSYKTGLSEDGKGYCSYYFNISELGIKKNEPFRFIVKASGVHGSAVLYSQVYEITSGKYQQYLFSGRLGGYVSFAMSGYQEISEEWDIENARYNDRNAKVRASKTATVKQYTGGLTATAATVLSELLQTEYAFHLVEGIWRPIVIDEPEMTFQTTESLKYGSFSFRYAYDITLRHIMP